MENDALPDIRSLFDRIRDQESADDARIEDPDQQQQNESQNNEEEDDRSDISNNNSRDESGNQNER